MKIRALIVDDEPLARRLVRDLAAADPEVEIIGECGDGRQAATTIRKLRPQLVFLDIQMPGRSGFEVLRQLTDDALPYVIFVTAYDDYAIQAFEVQALDYLLKPIDKQRFRAALERAKDWAHPVAQ